MHGLEKVLYEGENKSIQRTVDYRGRTHDLFLGLKILYLENNHAIKSIES